jgi:fatty acid desaturase 2 (delta-6 desaturase)
MKMNKFSLNCFFFQGASSHWWNFRHFQHHAKPNIATKDPDIDLPYLFLLGDKLPQIWGRKKKGFMPYNLQQHYFFLSKYHYEKTI